jgi:hypothetical protein
VNTVRPQDGRYEGERLKQGALDALESCRQAILLKGRRALLRRLLASPTATADDIREAVDLPEGMDPRVFGDVPGALARLGIIRATGSFVRSVRPARHASWLRVWELADRAAAIAWLAAHPEAPAIGPGGQLGLFDPDPAAAGGPRFDGRACP